MSNEDSTILTILNFKDGTGNADLDTQVDENAIELFERTPRFSTLEEIEAALQEGIYGNA